VRRGGVGIEWAPLVGLLVVGTRVMRLLHVVRAGYYTPDEGIVRMATAHRQLTIAYLMTAGPLGLALVVLLWLRVID
jgi:hypothetical protein